MYTLYSSLRYHSESSSNEGTKSGRKMMQVWNLFSGINSSSSESKFSSRGITIIVKYPPDISALQNEVNALEELNRQLFMEYVELTDLKVKQLLF